MASAVMIAFISLKVASCVEVHWNSPLLVNSAKGARTWARQGQSDL